MTTYQDVVLANNALAAWSLTEASGLAFAPYIGGSSLVGSGVFDYQQSGPFAASFGLGSHVGAKTTLTFTAVVSPPVTIEAWIKIASLPPAANQLLWGTGNGSANGVQPYVTTAGLINIQLGGVATIPTSVPWPSTGWHLFQMASSGLGNILTMAIDGVVRYRNSIATPNAPSPNVLTFTGDSAGGAGVPTLLAFPAFYATELTPSQMYASLLAATDAGAALQLTQTEGAGMTGSSLDLLNQNQAKLDLIYAAVHRSYA